MKIAVISPVFSLAGVPLAQVRFARALAARGHDVDLVLGWIDPQHAFPDLPDVNVIELKRHKVRQMLWPLAGYLRKAKPEAAFVAEDHLDAVTLLAAILARSKTRISCSSRVTPFDTYSNTPLSKRWVLKQMMRRVMWRADALTCVSRDMVEQYQTVFGPTRHTCVYNIVDDRPSRLRMLEPLAHEWFTDPDHAPIVAAGRLAPWKGFADLIRAMSLGPAERGARLLILGDGPLRTELQAQIDALGLQDSIRLEGYVDNPLKYFARARVFVLSSLVEGLPNVLVEAMMCGCTPVSTDCPTGPREVLDDGRVGYLVPAGDQGALAKAIVAALDSPVAGDVLQNAIRPFEENAVIDRHFELLGLKGDSSLAKTDR